MAQSPTKKTNYAADISLLTSQFQKSRPRLISGTAAMKMAPWSVAASGVDVNFVPTSISGCVLWLRADKGITIGTGVSAWADQSGTGDSNKNMSQAIGSQQPTLNASDTSYNGQATLSFAGASSQFLRSGTWSASLSQPQTTILVGNDDGSASSEYYIDGLSVNTNEFEYSNGAYFFASGSGVTRTGGSPLVAMMLYNGASSDLFVSAKTLVQTGSLTATVTGITLGCAGNTSAFLNGKIAEVIIYNSDIGSTNRANVWNYLGTRYGITIGA